MSISFIQRFLVGALVGLFISGVYWYDTIFFGHSISFIKGIIPFLILIIICGLITAKWGYKILESLVNSLYY